MAVEVALVTGQDMPKPDSETPLLSRALDALGIASRVEPWTGRFDWASVALVVVRTPWDYVGRRNEFLAWAEGVAAVTELVNPAPVLRWNSHKQYLEQLRDAGVRVPPTTLLRQGASAAQQAGSLESHRGEVVVKPAVSAGARGTLRCDATSPGAAAHLAAILEGGDALIQAFEPSILTRGEVSLVYFDGVYSHSLRKVPAPGDYRVQDRYGGQVHPHVPDDAEIELAQTSLLSSPAPSAYARVDLVETAEGPALMELEVIEPELFLRVDPEAPKRFARCLVRHLRGDAHLP